MSTTYLFLHIWRRGIVWGAGLLLCAGLAGCGLAERRTVVVTATPAGESPIPFVPSPTSQTAQPTALESTLGSVTSATYLLDGVCWEYLEELNGETWTWGGAEDLTAFYDGVDESELCAGVVTRGAFAFDGTVLLGTVRAATGCDAAYHVSEPPSDATGMARRYVAALTVREGCGYELLEPLVIAVPQPPDGGEVELSVAGP